ncbi:MAG: chemotaxis protein CheR [Oligoflexia bacterium]|nr:chemotaxis protein CheR [Oligoflexia bacterium]
MVDQSINFIPPEIHINDINGISEKEFSILSRKLFNETGITLNESKKQMIEGRLSRRLRELGLATFKQYIEFLKKNPSENELFINSLTTNKTDFFREAEHFHYLAKVVLPQFIDSGENKFRLWSAASSSGEEVYSLSIILHEFFSVREYGQYDFKIVGTDIDTEVLQKAQQGIYGRNLLAPVRPEFIIKYFKKIPNPGNDGVNDRYMVKNELKRIIKFRTFNLLKSEFSTPIKFNVIFLRNVLIYFLPETIEMVINKMYEHLLPGGYLFLGHSEALININHRFKYIKNSIYVK